MADTRTLNLEVRLTGAEKVSSTFTKIKKEGDSTTRTITKLDDAGRVLSHTLRTIDKDGNSVVRTFRAINKSKLEATSNAINLKAGYLAVSQAITDVIRIGGQLKGIVDSWIVEGTEAANVQAQLGAALRSTGESAGMTKDALNDQADALQRTSKFSDEATGSAQALLLTFGNVRGEIYRQAIPAIQDMATAMKQDLEATTIQVGKALQDPIAGVTALRRVGVAFTQQERDKIEVLVASGRAMEAQQMILAELSREFGGSATAAVNTYEGAVTKLHNAMGEVREQNAGWISDNPALTAAIGSIADSIFDVVDANGKWMDSNAMLVSSIKTAAVETVLELAKIANSFAKFLYDTQTMVPKFALGLIGKSASYGTNLPVVGGMMQTVQDWANAGLHGLQGPDRVHDAFGGMLNDAQNAAHAEGLLDALGLGRGGGKGSFIPQEFNLGSGGGGKGKGKGKSGKEIPLNGWGYSVEALKNLTIVGDDFVIMRADDATKQVWAGFEAARDRMLGFTAIGNSISGSKNNWKDALRGGGNRQERAYIGGRGRAVLGDMINGGTGWSDQGAMEAAQMFKVRELANGIAGSIRQRAQNLPEPDGKVNSFGDLRKFLNRNDSLNSMAGADDPLGALFSLGGGALGGAPGAMLGGGILRTIRGFFSSGRKNVETQPVHDAKTYQAIIKLTDMQSTMLNVTKQALIGRTGGGIDALALSTFRQASAVTI